METPDRGITERDVFVLLCKKKKDADRKGDLLEAFSALKMDEDGKVDTEVFFDFLVYNGYKYTEEQAQAVIKEADPKGTGKIDVSNFIDMMLNKETKKKKTKPKK